MRLIPRQRHDQRQRKPLISITEAEISADLHYPAPTREQQRSAARRLQVR